ncbi:uncharacterized protein LOC114340307 [Diabrotica virgifera virgifera]|uniref:Solute-binding protein family 3/N-terminal domain-containing protein n=1 Tax=Diabrotica virgifera virgifera TaxID=50390 RepID=A0ABM5JJ85_DIAVI|nr:uncharacterized protein LOC114340307 [Diabrotica virgifera virgifera]
MSQKLNFRLKFKQFTAENFTGAKSIGLKEISAGRVDILVGGSVVTEYRSKFYDFMWGYRFATYVTFFLTEHESSLGISNILISQILKTHYVPVLLVITSIIAYILNISTRLYGDRQSLQRDIEVSVGIFADRPLSVLTNFKKMPYRGKMKLLLAAWLIASVTSDAYFNAVIKAYLTFGKSTTTYLHDLIERGYSFVLTPNDYDFLSTYCQHSSALFCQKIFNNLHYSDNVCENLIKPRHAIVMDGIMALLFTAPIIRYPQNRSHSTIYNDISKCSFYEDTNIRIGITQLRAGEGSNTFFFSKSAPFEPAFSDIVLRLRDSGIIEYWTSNEAELTRNYLQNTLFVYNPRALTLEKLKFIFFLWCLGLLFAFLVFLEENRRYYGVRRIRKLIRKKLRTIFR